MEKRNNQKMFWGAIELMLELLDASIADERWKYSSIRELVRLRELLCEYLLGDNEMDEKSGFDNYFLYFIIVARKE